MELASNRTTKVWRRRLGAALRIAIACIIIGCTTLYGPIQIRSQIEYPAFAYVTAMLIVSESTLGNTLHGTWQAIIGTCLILGPAVLSLKLIGPTRFTPDVTAVAVAIGAFGVALTDSTSIFSKRLAFGQMVLIYVGTCIHGAQTDVVMHPFRVAASTGTGALASVLAMLVPLPRLATYEVRKRCKEYGENANERLNLSMEVLAAEEIPGAMDHVAEAKTLAEKATRLLQAIEKDQDGVVWEKPQTRLFLTENFKKPVDRLLGIEKCLRGMEMALASCSKSLLKDYLDQQLKDDLQILGKQLGTKLAQIKCSAPFEFSSSTVPDTKDHNHKRAEKKLIQTLNICPNHQNLPIFLFLFCMKHLNKDSPFLKSKVKTADAEKKGQDKCEKNHSVKKMFADILPSLPSYHNIIFALKCSISLGLAVFVGLLYNKQQGYWSGLTIAVSFVTRRQATFSTSNARAQGTALGSVYGILGCLLFHKFQVIKLTMLLPWIVFTTFLRHSKMYGEAGGVSAVVGALLILGRRKYGTPTEFAIARTTEACIGLFCMIAVEILMRPERAASLAKAKLVTSLAGLKKLIADLDLRSKSQDDLDSGCSTDDELRKLQAVIGELKAFIEEAKTEPNFWYKPFQDDCYGALLQSVSKMMDLLYFMVGSTESLKQDSHKSDDESCKDCQEKLETDFELFKAHMSASLEHLEETIAPLEKTPERLQDTAADLEMGKSRLVEAETILSSFLKHTNDVNQSMQAQENVKLKKKKKMLLTLGSLGYSMQCLMKETKELERVMLELVRRESVSL